MAYELLLFIGLDIDHAVRRGGEAITATLAIRRQRLE